MMEISNAGSYPQALIICLSMEKSLRQKLFFAKLLLSFSLRMSGSWIIRPQRMAQRICIAAKMPYETYGFSIFSVAV